MSSHKSWILEEIYHCHCQRKNLTQHPPCTMVYEVAEEFVLLQAIYNYLVHPHLTQQQCPSPPTTASTQQLILIIITKQQNTQAYFLRLYTTLITAVLVFFPPTVGRLRGLILTGCFGFFLGGAPGQLSSNCCSISAFVPKKYICTCKFTYRCTEYSSLKWTTYQMPQFGNGVFQTPFTEHMVPTALSSGAGLTILVSAT